MEIQMDSQTRKFLDEFNSLNLPPFESQKIQDIRNNSLFGYAVNCPINRVEEIKIPVSEGSIKLRIYVPEGQGLFPVFVTYHGGGWIAGNLDNHDAVCRQICSYSRYVIVSVDYRLAPEYKFPIPLNDCYQATLWAASDAIKKYSGDSTMVSVGGDSAGGNLATAVSLMARDNDTIRIEKLVLFYPVLDSRCNTESYARFAQNYFLTKNSMLFFWQNYLANDQDGINPYSSPLRAKNLHHMPETLIIVADFDPLRDEGIAFARRLEDASNKVHLKRYATIHAFISFADRLTVGKEALQDCIDFLK